MVATRSPGDPLHRGDPLPEHPNMWPEAATGVSDSARLMVTVGVAAATGTWTSFNRELTCGSSGTTRRVPGLPRKRRCYLPAMSFTVAATFSTRLGFGSVPYSRGSGWVGGGIGADVVGPSW
jgi:hypothetical protein